MTPLVKTLIYMPGSRESAQRVMNHLPEKLKAKCAIWQEGLDVSNVEYALAWGKLGELFSSLPDLKYLQSYGAGVDHLLSDPCLPEAIQLCRTPSREMAERMRNYVIAQVLNSQLRLKTAWEQQQSRVWLDYDGHWGKRVLILGYGEMGRQIASGLSLLGFEVVAWRREKKGNELHRIVDSQEALEQQLAGCDYLVNVLPLSPKTEGILNKDLFAHCNSAILINVGRGKHLLEEDLFAALENGLISEAILDVVEPEPLPEDHPFWCHDKIQITPHISGISLPNRVAEQLQRNLSLISQQQPPEHLVDREMGY